MNVKNPWHNKRLYLAGGWFSPEQAEEHTRIANLLDTYEGLNVFNPRTAGGDFKAGTETDHMSQVLMNNINAIQDADVVLVITDYKDMGTLWEAGYAFANAKPIIYYCETLGDKPFNLMLAKTGYVAKTTEQLVEHLNHFDEIIFETIHSYDGVIE